MRYRQRFVSLLGLLAVWQGLASCSDDPQHSGGLGGSMPVEGGAGGNIAMTGGVAHAGGAGSGAGENSGGAGVDTGGGGAGASPSSGDAGSAGAGGAAAQAIKPVTALVVLEGLRGDLISPTTTPYLWSLGQRGVRFSQHRAPLPSNRMAAAATLATGTSPATHGVLGSRMYLPGATATDSGGRQVDSSQPLDIEDRGTLESLQANLPGGLLRARTFLQVATSYGLRTTVIGRVGPASLFDLPRAGWILDDHYVWPRSFADWLNDTAQPGKGTLPLKVDRLLPDLVPVESPFSPQLEVKLLASPGIVDDGWTGYQRNTGVGVGWSYVDGTRARRHSVFDRAEETAATALSHLLETARLDVLVLWLREPGESLERYGAGSRAMLDALVRADKRFNDFITLLPPGSNVIVTSDGGGSTLAGDARLLPRYALSLPVPGIDASGWLPIELSTGMPMDGAVRLVDLLSRGGFTAYDGRACISGHAFTSYPTFRYDASWPPICQSVKGGELTGPAIAPAQLGPGAIVVASNGGSEFLHVTNHDAPTVKALTEFLQQRPEIGSIFAAPRYGDLPGALSSGLLGFGENAPDLLVTYAWDSADVVADAPFLDVGRPPSTWTRLGVDCSTKVCRGGLYCAQVDLPYKTCRFCPSDRDASDPLCGVASDELAAARAASVYLPAGELCESSAVCRAPLECSFGRCRAVGATLGHDPLAVPLPQTVRGSSFGAMAGLQVELDPYQTSLVRLLSRDVSGVRGGSAPSDLSAVLIAAGPAFKTGLVVDTPSGLADVAPTLLHALQPGLENELEEAEGRLLIEALADQSGKPSVTDASVESKASGRTFFWPGNPASTADTALATGDYTTTLKTVSVRQKNATYRYVVSAGATRTGLTCSKPADCLSHVCGAKGVCVASTCSDGVKNGLETAIDCGGPTCKACPNQACSLPTECASGKCTTGKCVAATCSDNVRNGNESSIDCGGSCTPCAANKTCRADADCASGRCGVEMVSRVCR
ncbi:MAG: alkaline phosphatase family protein [Myxococcota bacterium]